MHQFDFLHTNYLAFGGERSNRDKVKVIP